MGSDERRDIYIGLTVIAALGGLLLLTRNGGGSPASQVTTTASPVVLNNANSAAVPTYAFPSVAAPLQSSPLRPTLPNAAGLKQMQPGNISVIGGNTVIDVPVLPGINLKLPAILTQPLPSFTMPGTNIVVGGDTIIGGSPDFNITGGAINSPVNVGTGGGGGCGCSSGSASGQTFLSRSDLLAAQTTQLAGSNYTTNLASAAQAYAGNGYTAFNLGSG
jgi:hypothetical protein